MVSVASLLFHILEYKSEVGVLDMLDWDLIVVNTLGISDMKGPCQTQECSLLEALTIFSWETQRAPISPQNNWNLALTYAC